MSEKSTPKVPPPQAEGTPRQYFTSKKGKRFYAIDYGHKCWPIGKSQAKRVK